MPPKVLYVNDVDMSQFGLWINQPDGWSDAPRSEADVETVPGVAGGFSLFDERVVSTRELTLTGILSANSQAEAQTMWDAAKKVFMAPQLEVRFGSVPTAIALLDEFRVAECRYTSMDWLRVPGLTSGAPIRITLAMDNPYLLGIQTDVYHIGLTEQVPLKLGTAPSSVSLRLVGNGSERPTVYYRDAQGTIRGWIAYNATLPDDEWIEVDEWGISYWHEYGQEDRSADIYLEGHLFVADPLDGDGTVGPTLQAVNCRVAAYVRKACL
jgi:hypothetical protein